VNLTPFLMHLLSGIRCVEVQWRMTPSAYAPYGVAGDRLGMPQGAYAVAERISEA
jgi:hypothetical protein